MEITELHKIFLESEGVNTDTRTIRPNQLFFALSGENFDGNQYAQQAIDKGASFAVVDDMSLKGNQLIYSNDVLETLQALAQFHRKYLGIPVLSLTGSNGKTTTKELINAVLSKKFKTLATKGNLNNHIGVPLTLLAMDKTTEFGIVEMGANHMEEIALLSSISQPNYGLITNVGKAHLEGFGSEENILIGKTELYDYLEKDKNSTVFVNTKDQRLLDRSSKIQCIYFGLDPDKRHLISTELIEDNPSIKIKFDSKVISSHLMGTYNAENISAAISIGKYFNINDENIKDAVEAYIPSNNRSQLLKTSKNSVILDAYNANPTSMLLSIQNFEKNQSTAPKTVILGDMFELGNASQKEHSNIVTYLENSNHIDTIILVGAHFLESSFNKNITAFKTTSEVITFIKNTPLKNNHILIKGSRGMKLETLLDYI